jgi:hypothetical protein
MELFMDILDYATDETAEQDGKWFDIGVDTQVKLRSYTSQKSRDVRRQLDKPYVGITRSGGVIPDDVQEKLLIQQMAKAIIVDWKGLKENKVEVPFSATKAEELLTKYPRFRNMIASIVASDSSFSAEILEASEKN